MYSRLLQSTGGHSLSAALPKDSSLAARFVLQVLAFLNAFLLLNDGNRLAVFCIHTAIRQVNLDWLLYCE